VFKVYWTGSDEKAYGKEFTDMSKALNFAQELRNNHQRQFVTMCSENPDNIGKMGVAEAGSDYNWKKRRI
jgi:hypothetical protein